MCVRVCVRVCVRACVCVGGGGGGHPGFTCTILGTFKT